MNDKEWEVTTSNGEISPHKYSTHLLSGFKEEWGYSSNNIVLRNIEKRPSCSFTVFAFKEVNGILHIGVRANIKGGYGNNLKMLTWNKWDNAAELVCKMIYMFLTEMGYKLQKENNYEGTCCIN